jgi:phosphatidylglycerophosphatase A
MNTALKLVPHWKWILRSPHYFIAFGFGSGLMPKAPGTFGSLAAIPTFWLSGLAFVPPLWQCIILSLLFPYGCYIAQICGTLLGEHDHKGIVFDEIWAMWLMMCIFPKDILTQILIFGCFRLFDITKPYPIKQFEKKHPNGYGVMLDDALATIYAGACVFLIKLFI